MAKFDPSTTIGSISVKHGDLVFVQNQDGSVTVRRRLDRKNELKEGELLNQSRFARAAAYVRRLRQDAAAYGVYESAAHVQHKRACNLATADFYRRPEIRHIDVSGYFGRPGERILIEAVDDFEVIVVTVIIAELSGAVLEDGSAVNHKGSSKWVYVSQRALTRDRTVAIHVLAMDRPMNVVNKSIHRAIPAD